jgi:hypothetical protein
VAWLPRPLLVGAKALARSAAAKYVEERWLSDFAELTRLSRPSANGAANARTDGVFEVTYGYLDGGPLAGQSTYRIRPDGPDRCRLEVRFEFQELGLPAIFLLHTIGVRAHDRAVRAQVEQAAGLLGAPILDCTLSPS